MLEEFNKDGLRLVFVMFFIIIFKKEIFDERALKINVRVV